jgi:prepilin-type N-terminal cleavage/methylation domain-containing protein
MQFHSKGFTVIELLVVVSVISVILAISAVQFPAIQSQYRLNQAANNFIQDVARARETALSRLPYAQSGQFGQNYPKGAGIYINLSSPGNRQYLLYANNTTSAQEAYSAGTATVLATIDMSQDYKGVMIKEINTADGTINSVSIHFTPPGPTASLNFLTDSYDGIEVVFALAGDISNTKKVFIGRSGLAAADVALPEPENLN